MATRLSEKKRQEHEERALRTARGIAEVDRVMRQEDLASRDLYITNVAPDPEQPRRLYPEDEHELQELAESIRRNGLLQPISVRPDPADPERFLIIVGERRWRASRLAGKTRIRAVVHYMDEYAVRAAQYAENNKRADVSDVSRARSLQAMYEEERKRGGGWAEVAAASGITRMHVNRLTSLLRLPDPVIEMVDRKLLASAHGYELVRIAGHLPDEEIIRLAQSSRKPRRGEAYARSVESLREHVNEVLAHVQRTSRPAGRASGSAGEGSARGSAQRTGDPGPGPLLVQETPASAEAQSETEPPAGAAEVHASSPTGASWAETDAVRPHVRQVLHDLAGGLLRPEEARLLREALGGGAGH